MEREVQRELSEAGLCPWYEAEGLDLTQKQREPGRGGQEGYTRRERGHIFWKRSIPQALPGPTLWMVTRRRERGQTQCG